MHVHDAIDTHCAGCAIDPFTRNHYFTGKLLVERDFTDEQRYQIDKLRHHHQRLHGSGVVCGLRVVAHPSPGCRDRFVCIEPGTAIDCCGHEVLVPEEECVELAQLPALRALREAGDTDAHRLQICIRYRECPTEEIPVLYDECGCDDTRCAPNRVLESYDVDVLVDADLPPSGLHTPRLTWEHTLPLARAMAVALHAPTRRLAVVTATPGAESLYLLSTDNHATIASAPLPAPALALAFSEDGSRLYVVTEGAAGPRVLHVLDPAAPASPPIQSLDLPGSDGSPVELALDPADGRLLALLGQPGVLLRYAADIDVPGTPAAPESATLAPGLQGLVAHGSGRAFSAEPASAQIQVVDLATFAAAAPITDLPTGAEPVGLAPVRGPGGGRLAVIDRAGPALHLIGIAPATLLGSAALGDEPTWVTASPSGGHAYVLERNGAAGALRPVDLGRVEHGIAGAAGDPLPLGLDARAGALRPDGALLYLPYAGAAAASDDGGVALVEITEHACADLLWHDLDGCPACDAPDCLVLATIEGYHVGDRIEDPTTPPSDPAADAAAHIVRIDNRTGRRLLPSTATLTAVIECLLEHAIGTDGQDGRDGVDGEGLERGLTQIRALSWAHGREGPLLQIPRLDGTEALGFVIAFTRAVRSGDVTAPHVFEALVELPVEMTTPYPNGPGMSSWFQIASERIPVDAVDDGAQRVLSAKETTDALPLAVALVIDPDTLVGANLRRGEIRELWIRLRGEFVRDEAGRAIDAEFARAELPTGDRPAGGPAGAQGGLFESWFRPLRADQPPDVNTATRRELLALDGIGSRTAEAIMRERRARPFTDLDDLRSRVRFAPSAWDTLRDTLTTVPPEE